MNAIRSAWPALVLAVIALSGCASGSLYDKPTRTVQPIPMAAYTLEVRDQRTTSDRTSPSTPLISFPWQEDKVSPVFDAALRQRLNRLVHATQQPGNRTLNFEVELLEGWQGFSAELFSEKETVSWHVNLTVDENNRAIGQSTGRCEGSRRSVDASQDELRRMYYACFERAVKSALNSLTLEPG